MQKYLPDAHTERYWNGSRPVRIAEIKGLSHRDPKMPFTPNDPPELLNYSSMKEVLAYHEAGHLLLAYYYGYQIGMFRFWDNNTNVFGSVRNRRSENPPGKDTLENLAFESRKLLAGEIAARMHMTLPLDDFCLPLTAPESKSVTKDTPFTELKYVVNQRVNHDGIKFLEQFRMNQETIPSDWWTWFWKCHAETVELIQKHWDILVALAARLQAVEVDEFDPEKEAMQGYSPGKVLLQWCAEVGAPRLNPELMSMAY